MEPSKTREIRVDDYRDIYLLNREFNPNLHLFSEEQVKRKIEIIADQTNDIVFVYEHDDEVVGYIHGSPYELLFADSLVNILGFVVKGSHRKQGIGGLLIDRLEQWGRANGYSGMKLLSHPSRVQAHAFYERRGYRFTKDQKNYIKTFEQTNTYGP